MSSFITPLLSLIGIHALIMLFAIEHLNLLTQRFAWQWQQYQQLQQRAYELAKAQRFSTYRGDDNNGRGEHIAGERLKHGAAYADRGPPITGAATRVRTTASGTKRVIDGNRKRRGSTLAAH